MVVVVSRRLRKIASRQCDVKAIMPLLRTVMRVTLCSFFWQIDDDAAADAGFWRSPPPPLMVTAAIAVVVFDEDEENWSCGLIFLFGVEMKSFCVFYFNWRKS